MVSSTTPLHHSACCACRALSPELGCSGRRLTKRRRVSLMLKAASSLSLFAPCAWRFTWAVSFSCAAARWPSTHAVELCQIWSSSEGSCEAASGRCSRISPSRGPVEGLMFLQALSVGDSCARLLRSLPTWLRRVSDVAVTPLRLLQAPPLSKLVTRVSYPLHLLIWPSASRARHRLSVTKEMLGWCCCSDAMSSSSFELGAIFVSLETSSQQF